MLMMYYNVTKMNKKVVKNNNIKMTKHKLAILKLFENYKHLDASQIHNLLNKQEKNISLATIYRILSSFEKSGVIIKNNFHEDQAIYELANPNEHHDHLICTKCHKVIEFFNCQIEKIQTQIAMANNFIIINHHLNLYGICAECNNQKNKDEL